MTVAPIRGDEEGRSDLRGLGADAPAAHALVVDRGCDGVGVVGGDREEGEVLEHLDVVDGLAVEGGAFVTA